MGKTVVRTIIEFSATEIRALRVETGPAGIIGVRKESISLPIENVTVEKDKYTAALRALLGKCDVGSSIITVLLPRNQIFMRMITVPPGNDQEVRGMLQFEAEKNIPFSPETAVIDYYPLESINKSRPNTIMLVAVKRETVDRYLEILDASGIVPDAISVSTIGFSNLFAAFPQNAGVWAFAAVNNDGFEIDMFKAGAMLLSRGFPLDRKVDASALQDILARELRQSFQAFSVMYPDTAIKAVFCLEPDRCSSLQNALSQENVLPCSAVNARDIFGGELGASFLSGGEGWSKYAGAAGMIIRPKNAVNLIPVDILETRRRKKNRKLRAVIAGAVIVCAAVILGIVLILGYRRSVCTQTMSRKMKSMETEMKVLKRKDQNLRIIDDFTANNFVPLNMLRELSIVMPKNVYIVQFQYDEKESVLLIRGRANSYSAASVAVAQMSRSPMFRRVSNKGSHMIKAGNSNLVDFEVEAEPIIKSRKNEPDNEKI